MSEPPPKRRGRPRRVTFPLLVRLPMRELASIDRYIAEQRDPKPNRQEAFREMAKLSILATLREHGVSLVRPASADAYRDRVISERSARIKSETDAIIKDRQEKEGGRYTPYNRNGKRQLMRVDRIGAWSAADREAELRKTYDDDVARILAASRAPVSTE